MEGELTRNDVEEDIRLRILRTQAVSCAVGYNEVRIEYVRTLPIGSRFVHHITLLGLEREREKFIICEKFPQNQVSDTVSPSTSLSDADNVRYLLQRNFSDVRADEVVYVTLLPLHEIATFAGPDVQNSKRASHLVRIFTSAFDEILWKQSGIVANT